MPLAPPAARCRMPVVIAMLALACSVTVARAADPGVVWPVPAGAGLTAAERARFYHLDEGGEIIPLDWLRALSSKRTGRPFMERLERIGFIADPADPAGLPVGMTTRPSASLPGAPLMVGVTCAACHVGQLEYQGHKVRIEGGTNMLSFDDFLGDIGESIAATVANPGEVFAFLHRLMQQKDAREVLARRRGGAAALFANVPTLDALARRGATGKLLAAHLEKLFGEESARPAVDLVAASTPPSAPAARGVLGRLEKLLDRGVEDVRTILEKGESATEFIERFAAGGDGLVAVREMVGEFRDTVILLKAREELLVKIAGQMRGTHKLQVTQGGPGRGDDWAIIRNQILPPEAAIPVIQQLKFPPLWGFGRLAWLHYDGNTNSVMQRNAGQSLGTGAMFDPETHASTVEPRNLHELEQLARKLVAPRWPEDVFGRIDGDAARRGSALFKTHCAECHQPLADPPLFDVATIGTDPLRAGVFAKPVGDRAFREVLAEAADKYLTAAYDRAGVPPAERRAIEPQDPQWRDTGKYTTRDLASCWASPPYLHNGSVPTLADLITPVAGRPQRFWIGHREYDPVRLGYTHLEGPIDRRTVDFPAFEFDTTQAGNSNAGHEFGTDLPAADKADLLEYLKTH